jgi:hypothetical protein
MTMKDQGRESMAKDGRLQIRFGKLLDDITRLAAADERTPSGLVRLVMKKFVKQQQRKAKVTKPVAAN